MAVLTGGILLLSTFPGHSDPILDFVTGPLGESGAVTPLTPKPSSLLLWGTSLVSVGALIRRRRQNRQTNRRPPHEARTDTSHRDHRLPTAS